MDTTYFLPKYGTSKMLNPRIEPLDRFFNIGNINILEV